MFFSQLWNPWGEYQWVRQGMCGTLKWIVSLAFKMPSQNWLLVMQSQGHLQTRNVLCRYCNFHLPSCISKLLEIIRLIPDNWETELIYSSVPQCTEWKRVTSVSVKLVVAFLFILVSVHLFYFQYVEQYICSINYKYWLDISDIKYLLEKVHWLVSMIHFVLLFSWSSSQKGSHHLSRLSDLAINQWTLHSRKYSFIGRHFDGMTS